MLGSDNSEVQAAIDAGEAIAKPTELEPNKRYAYVVPAGAAVEIVDRAIDAQLENPRRKTGTTAVYDASSFVEVWKKHQRPESDLFADPLALTVTAVIDADEATGETANDDLGIGLAGWRSHRVVLTARKTAQWQAWERIDGTLLDQETFAEFVEDRIIDFVTPPGAEMLELAQTFSANTKVDFKSGIILNSSQRTLQFEETVQAKAGQKGEITIPATVEVGLTPFEGGAPYRVVARLRYRIRDGHLAIGFKMERPEDILRTAFSDIQTAIAEATDAPVLLGTAPPAR